MHEKTIILGGSGYIGSILKAYDNSIICFNSKDYNSNHISDNIKILNYINSNDIKRVIDLTRNNKLQLISFYFLQSQLSQKITYITLTSFSLIDNNIYGNDKNNIIDLNISMKINQYLSKYRQKFYSFITPQITDTNNVIVKDAYALKSNYTYYCMKDIFTAFIFNVINTKPYGIYQIPAKKFIISVSKK